MSKRPDPAALRHYLRAGYDLIPLHRWDHVDERGRRRGKTPLHKDWRTRDYSGFDFAAWMEAGGNVGARLRDTDVVVDVDPRNFPEGEDSFAEMVLALGLDPEAWHRVRTGSGGEHYYLRKPAALRIVGSLPNFPGVEFKTAGTQVVAVGSLHPETGERYALDALSTLDVREDAPTSLLDPITRPEPAPRYGSPTIEPELLARLLSGLDPEDYGKGRQDEWLWIMMAAHHATAGEGRQEFIEWSTLAPGYADHGALIGRRWDSLDPKMQGGRTLGTILRALRDAGRGDLADLARTAGASDRVAEAESPEEAVDALNERHAAVSEGGRITVFNEEVDPETGYLRWTRSTPTDFGHLYANRRFGANGGVSIATTWMRSPRRRQYRGVAFDPAGTEPDVLNLWRGWGVPAVEGDWTLMQGMIRDVICAGDRASLDYAMNWLAYLFQHPERQAEVAFVMRGRKGVGKGTLAEAVLSVAGAHGMAFSDIDKFAGKFNAHLRDRVFVFADEAFWAGDRAKEGTLKKLITDRDLAFEGKFQAVTSGRNRIHLMMASNEEWTVPASLGDERRFFVVDVSEERRGDRAYFGAVRREMAEGGLSAMLHDLQGRDIRGWHPRQDVPHTGALADQMMHSLTPMQEWWFGILERGELPVGAVPFDFDWRAQAPSLGPAEKNALVENYARFLKDRGIARRGVAQRGMIAFLGEYGVAAEKVDRDTRAWIVPPLDAARGAFRARLGHDPFG